VKGEGVNQKFILSDRQIMNRLFLEWLRMMDEPLAVKVNSVSLHAAHLTSMEDLADISEPHIPPNE